MLADAVAKAVCFSYCEVIAVDVDADDAVFFSGDGGGKLEICADKKTPAFGVFFEAIGDGVRVFQLTVLDGGDDDFMAVGEANIGDDEVFGVLG